MRTIGVVTVARSDYGIYLPLLRSIQADSELHLHLIVAGMHLSPEFGLTVEAIEADGFEIGDRVEMLLSSDTPEGIAKSVGVGVMGFAQSYAHFNPDILVVLGDRFEMLAAVFAALPYNIPLAHIHGGETTEGAIDEAIRHSITKMSHLHFAATKTYAKRIIQMGEDPWRVTVSGALSLDNLRTIELLHQTELEDKIGFSLMPAPLLVTYHPVTLEYSNTAIYIKNLLYALDVIDLPVIFTYPNADMGGRLIIEAINRFVQNRKKAIAVTNLGTQTYFSLMQYATAMVGNSSSGIIEAASFKLPVVNIGTRQQGRVRASNVIDVGYEWTEIVDGIKQIDQPEYRKKLRDLINPYDTGQATDIIVRQLKQIRLNDELLMKHFFDLEESLQ